MSERQGSRGYVTKTRRLTRHKAVLLLLAAVIFLCLILSGCGSTVDSADSSEELKLIEKGRRFVGERELTEVEKSRYGLE